MSSEHTLATLASYRDTTKCGQYVSNEGNEELRAKMATAEIEAARKRNKDNSVRTNQRMPECE